MEESYLHCEDSTTFVEITVQSCTINKENNINVLVCLRQLAFVFNWTGQIGQLQ